MPGETLDHALSKCSELEDIGYGTIITYLGENSLTKTQTLNTVKQYKDALASIDSRPLKSVISVKLTQLGLDIDEELCVDNLKQLLNVADLKNTFVWIDMEEYIYLELTLKIYKKLIQKHNNIGITLQSYLYRSEDDLESLLDIAPYIRLVKGAYAENSSVSMHNRNEIYDNYIKLANIMLEKNILKNGLIPSFATHDHQIIYSLINKINADKIDKSHYEFNMLYGIRRDLQDEILNSDQNLKILISYGEEWFPWYVRRLAENPKNLILLIK
jgi:proline dehydrogenase